MIFDFQLAIFDLQIENCRLKTVNSNGGERDGIRIEVAFERNGFTRDSPGEFST